MGSELNASIDGLRGEVRSMGAELNTSIERLNTKVAELRTEVSEAVELLPDSDGPGPIARARDALAGNDPGGDR